MGGWDPISYLLFLGYGMQRQRRLARAFRPVDLDHPALRQPADTERYVEPDRTRGNRLDVPGRLGVPHAHDRALAELLFDLAKRLC